MRGDSLEVPEDVLARRIIGAAIEVHRQLGPGLLESVYEACLYFELVAQGIAVRRQVEIPVLYKGNRIDCAFRMDLLADELVVIELKSVDALSNVHLAQCMTYLRLADKRLCLLFNFNVVQLRDGGIRRVVRNLPE